MLDFTSEERRVILFLVSLCFLGLSASFLSKKFSSIQSIPAFSIGFDKVNLNTADKALLMSVSGIGEKLSQRIIEYRIENLNFRSLEELKNIKGMSEYRYQKIKDYLTLK